MLQVLCKESFNAIAIAIEIYEMPIVTMVNHCLCITEMYNVNNPNIIIDKKTKLHCKLTIQPCLNFVFVPPSSLWCILTSSLLPCCISGTRFFSPNHVLVNFQLQFLVLMDTWSPMWLGSLHRCHNAFLPVSLFALIFSASLSRTNSRESPILVSTRLDIYYQIVNFFCFF